MCVYFASSVLWDGNSSQQRSSFKRNMKDVTKGVQEESSKERKCLH